MKNTTFKRIISMVLICMTLVGTLAGFGVSAETAAPTVEIVSNNVRYDDTIRLMYAVKAENLPEGASVTVTLTDANGNVYDTIADGTVTIDGVECYKFISKYGVPAHNIDETLTATATVAGTEATDTQEYSVLEYFYERLYVSENVTEEQRTLYNALIEYAKKADIVLNNLETSGIDNLAYVVLEGEGAIYTVGAKIELTTDIVPDEGKKIVWSVNDVELTDEEAAAGYTVVAGFANIVAKTVEDDAPVAEPAWTLVTDLSQLSAGKQVVIATAPSTGKDFALGADAGNYRNNVAITRNADGTLNIADGVEILTLVEGATAGTFGLQSSTGYLYAISGKNNLKTKADLAADGSWTITVDGNGVAVVSTVVGTETREIEYNSSSPRFSAYKNTQADICIYVFG